MASTPRQLDLTNPEHLSAVRAGAESIESASAAASVIADLENEALRAETDSIGARVSLKLALSRRSLAAIMEPVHVSVVFAAYKEHQRLRTASEHPLGEDALREKLRQLRWLFGAAPQHSWDLTVVDDGCPEGSGDIAAQILDEALRPGEDAQVLFLAEAIAQNLPIVQGMTSTSDSQKGGAIRLGLWHAAQTNQGPRHFVVFTDADLSTHLGQIGLLVSPLIDSDYLAAVGSRRETSSVVVKSRGRDSRGKLFIYLWKRLLPQLRGIVDTQCGFKAFRVDNLRSWITETRDNGFSFDIEALSRLCQIRSDAVAKVPVAWIDSEAASTTTELEPYLPMLKSVVGLYRSEGTASDGEPYAALIEALDHDSFRVLTSRVPEAITSRDPQDFDGFDGVSADELARLAGLG